MMMDGLASNGGSGTQQSREPAHSHHRGSGFVTPPYSTPTAAQSSCAAAGSASHLDSLHARPSYSASSSSSQSPSRLAGAPPVAAAAPPPRNSDVHHQAAVSNTYSATYPAADYAVPHSSSSASYHEATKSSAPEPPKKPLSPYMRFSKSVGFPYKL